MQYSSLVLQEHQPGSVTCADQDLYTDVLGLLVMIQPLFTDDSGKLLASIHLSHIMKAANLTHLTFKSCGSGTFGTVNFILQAPSGTEYLSSGWPNFQLCQKITEEEWQLGLSVEENIGGVGEIQRPRSFLRLLFAGRNPNLPE